MNSIRLVNKSRRRTQGASIIALLMMWAGTAFALPGNPKDPPLPPSSFGAVYGSIQARSPIGLVPMAEPCALAGTLRLQEGNTDNEGRLELCADAPGDNEGMVWGSICDHFWSEEDASTACRQLGFARAEAGISQFVASHFGTGSGRIFLDDMQCAGTESDLLDCPTNNGPLARNVIGVHNCGTDELVGIRCLSAPGEAGLSDISVQDWAVRTLTPAFDTDHLTYNTEVVAGHTQVVVRATKIDDNATLEYLDSNDVTLSTGETLQYYATAGTTRHIKVKVVATDGTERIYNLYVERDE